MIRHLLKYKVGSCAGLEVALGQWGTMQPVISIK